MTLIYEAEEYGARGRRASNGNPRKPADQSLVKPCTRCGRDIHPKPQEAVSEWNARRTCGVDNSECLNLWAAIKAAKKLQEEEGYKVPDENAGLFKQWGVLSE